MNEGGLSRIFDIQSANFQTYIVAIAINEFDIFSVLAIKPMTCLDVAQKFEIDERPAEALLNTCVALGLLEKNDVNYSPTLISEEYLVKGNPHYVGEIFQLVGVDTYSQLKKAIKTNKKQIYGDGETWEVHQHDEEKLRFFTEAMHCLSIIPGESIANIVDFSKYKVILDIGGGSGAIPIMIALQYPHINAIIYDLAPVCGVAKEFIAKANLQDRISTKSGNFFKDPFPDGFDVAILSNILHDWNESTCAELLKKIYHSLPNKGAVIINEALLNEDKCSPLFCTLYSLGMLIWTEGRQYTGGEIIHMLENIGFTNINITSTEGYYKIVTAIKEI